MADMFLSLLSFLILSVSHECSASLPVTLSPSVINNVTGGPCPSVQERNSIRDELLTEVEALLRNRVIPALNLRSLCPCGGRDDWTRIAFLNMSDPSVQCPSNWSLIETPVRGCRRLTPTGAACDSVFFSSNGRNYSRVCGRVTAFQQGSTDAFIRFVSSVNNLDSAYLDGVSVTHGSAGQRQHIWSFFAGLNERSRSAFNCPCVSGNMAIGNRLPPFVGDNYFCESGNPTSTFNLAQIFSNDPLWDGDGCGPSTCCRFNNPPQFCATLPKPTTDDIEVRICLDQSNTDENIIVNLVDINIS